MALHLSCGFQLFHYFLSKVIICALILYNRCNWDGGDCIIRNEEMKLEYADCQWDIHVGNIADLYCDWDLNNQECGFDGGDCIDFNNNFPDCLADDPGTVGDSICDYGYYNSNNKGEEICKMCSLLFFTNRRLMILTHILHPTNVKECGWDGGDCISSSDITALQNKFPNCTWSRFAEIGDGFCDEPANIEECGFDDGDCMVPNTFPNCNVNDTSWIGDSHCDEYYDIKECGWDLGDCHDDLSSVSSKYPNCTSFRLAEVGDGHCDAALDIEECGFDDGDCR